MLSKKNEKMIDTVIGKDTVIEGKIKLPSSLRIDGKVLGEIECNGDVYIGKTGSAEPSIKAKHVIVAGEAKGAIYTNQTVHVEASGSVTGDIESSGIIIDEGGLFVGTSKVNVNESKRPRGKIEPITAAESKA
ncbi:protein CcmA, bactofilin family [Amphibacillus marinus]|uniref:Protein CcmA, bactofilin family n=1 Tax=Amphibacillus marinus TaxID=872970 RepID=A0A1H8MA94_9BACI|nr:polymer-forming cytoskeletal protein [Amphibacillus marinus]SEO14307.1 protein CcmA, bactofilin family [Amphibacillus marinus]